MKTNKKNLFAIILLTLTLTQVLFAQELKVGDIIFQKSQSTQSAALNEATGSPWTHVGILVHKGTDTKNWYVAEAIGPVKITAINDFIARGKNKEYRIYRYPRFNPETMTAELSKTIQKYNKPYDIYFEFTDERIYCSELVFKTFEDITGRGVGNLQKMKEMRLDGPYVKALIKKRYTDIGKPLDPDEIIITPISQMSDSELELVKTSN